jgi:hypothetical protein
VALTACTNSTGQAVSQSADGKALPVTFIGSPKAGDLVAGPGMTFLPCHLMIRGVLSPGSETRVDC